MKLQNLRAFVLKYHLNKSLSNIRLTLIVELLFEQMHFLQEQNESLTQWMTPIFLHDSNWNQQVEVSDCIEAYEKDLTLLTRSLFYGVSISKRPQRMK